MAAPIFYDKFADPPFEWGDKAISGTGQIVDTLVEKKFNDSMDKATDLYTSMITYVQQLDDIIVDYSRPEIDDFTVTIPTISVAPDTRPVPTMSGLDLNFPVFGGVVPSMTALPTIDLSSLNPADLPDEIAATITWVEQAHDTTLFVELLTRLISDLQAGATGLDAQVEQGIYDRAKARQEIEEDKIQTDIEEYFSSTDFDLPTGALAARLEEHANGRAMRVLDMNQKIAQDQAELAQKNSQAMMQAAIQLEGILVDFTNKKNDRALDYAKAVAANIIAVYAEGIRAYIAAAEANKAYVQVQIENLKAVVEYNKGLIQVFAAEAEAYGTVIESIAKRNEAITEIYKAEVTGYEAETRAVTAAQGVTIEEYRLRIQNADIQLRTAIAEVEAELKAYGIEAGLRVDVGKALTNIAQQALASIYGAVNMSAGLSHGTGVHRSESHGHTESRSISYGKSEGLSESHSYEEPTDVA